MIGIDTNDDAGIVRLTPDIALVQTVDYVTPMVADPFLYGQIAAANSLSDVYAKGGRPYTVLNVCNFPQDISRDGTPGTRLTDKGIDPETMLAILQGGLSKTIEAGALLMGGHTVRDPELKYGLSVTGLIHPKDVVRNSTAQPGDRLILTKPVGTGVLITAYRQGKITADLLHRIASESMAVLNKVASETMLEFKPSACTDLTGFGLGGHLLWMVKAAKVGMRVWADRVPFFPESLELAHIKTGVTDANRSLVADWLTVHPGTPEDRGALFCDPQTSGGLVITVAADRADALVAKLRANGIAAADIIGEVFETNTPGLHLHPNA